MINVAIHDLNVGWRKRVIDQRDWKEENRAVVISILWFGFGFVHTYCTVRACARVRVYVLVATGLVSIKEFARMNKK